MTRDQSVTDVPERFRMRAVELFCGIVSFVTAVLLGIAAAQAQTIPLYLPPGLAPTVGEMGSYMVQTECADGSTPNNCPGNAGQMYDSPPLSTGANPIGPALVQVSSRTASGSDGAATC